jgi:hypothetical protein
MRPVVETTTPCINEQSDIVWCSTEQPRVGIIKFDAFSDRAFEPTAFEGAERHFQSPNSVSHAFWSPCEPLTRVLWMCLIAAMFSACNTVPAGMESLSSVAPSPVVNTSDVPSSAMRFHATSADSCPSGAVVGFNASDVHETTVTFRWHQTGTPDVQVEIERRDVTNAFAWAGSFVTNDYATSQEWHAQSGGVYRARIRTRSCGDHYGPWGDWISFGVDDGLDGDWNSGPNASGDAEGNQGGAFGGNAGSGVGSGGDNLGGSGNGGGSCPNGGSGDHNGDGHPDCGIGNGGTPPGQPH